MPSIISRPLDIELFFKDLSETLKRLVQISKNNILVGIKSRLNFIPGTNVTLDITDNPATKAVDIKINSSGGSGGLTDGNYGDVTVSGAGTAITVNNDAITDAKLRNSAGNSVIGRSVAGAGDPADIVAAVADLPLRLNTGVVAFGAIPESSVTNLVTDLAGKVPTTRTISTTLPLTGGGDLSANRTIDINNFTASGIGHTKGTVPDPGAVAGTTKFLREDATFAVPLFSSTAVSINVTTPTYELITLISDPAVGVSSKILLVDGQYEPTDTNFPGDVEFWASGIVAGKFNLTIASRNNNQFFGIYKFLYTIG